MHSLFNVFIESLLVESVKLDATKGVVILDSRAVLFSKVILTIILMPTHPDRLTVVVIVKRVY